MSVVYVGIDVSKETLEVCALWGTQKRTHRFKNVRTGFEQLETWALSLGAEPRFCLESTGWYSQGLAFHLHEKGRFVALENPRFIKHFAHGAKIQNKTDTIDARAIAEYLRRCEPEAFVPREPHYRELSGLVNRHRELQASLGAESNRLKNPHLEESVRNSIKRHVDFLKEEVSQVLKEAKALVTRTPELLRDVQAMKGILGMGELSSMRVLADLGDVASYKGAQSYGASAGLNPKRRESGKYQGRTTISRCGGARLRADLYMATLTAARYHPVLKEFYDRLLARGKPKKAALIATMRKLLMICYGVQKRIRDGLEPFGLGTPEDPKAKRRARDAKRRADKRRTNTAPTS